MSKEWTFSQLAIGMLEMKYPGLKTRGLREELRDFLPEHLCKFYDTPEARENFYEEFTIEDCIKGGIEDVLRDISFVPDAFRFIRETGELQLFEVEDTHMLTIGKLELIISAWAAFEENGLVLRLFVTDRYGANIRELDLELYDDLLYGH